MATKKMNDKLYVQWRELGIDGTDYSNKKKKPIEKKIYLKIETIIEVDTMTGISKSIKQTISPVQEMEYKIAKQEDEFIIH